MFIRVDLPEPLEPMIATYSPLAHLEIDAPHGGHLLGAHRVDLVQVADLDQGLGSSIGLLRPASRG